MLGKFTGRDRWVLTFITDGDFYIAMMTSQLIDDLGGSASIARSIGIGINTVGNWRKRGVPPWAKPYLIKLCEERGVDPGGELDPTPPRRLRSAG